jgi:2-keto-4-pentenoate hydratase
MSNEGFMDTAAQNAAGRLLDAYRTGESINPLTPEYPGAPLELAYRIQQIQVEQWTQAGDAVKGHKVGLASRAIQRQMGVDQPDFGHLTASMFHLEHIPVAAGRFLQPRIEPEVAFVLGRPLAGPGVTTAEAARAVDFVLPALEIVDSRIRDWQIGIFDTIADNASSGGVILGSRPVALGEIDLRLIGCTLHINGELVATGAGGAVLGSPLNALVWLANTVGPLGVALEPGHVVLPGSMTRAFPVSAGDSIVAAINGFGGVTAVLAGKDEK